MSEYTLSQVSPTDKTTLAEIDALLQKEGIRRDGNLDYICAMFDEDYHVIGTGSCFGNTLRCFAVSSDHQGEGLLNQIITHLIEVQCARGNLHLFLYTKGKSSKFFGDLGFYEIARVDDTLVFMENRRDGFGAYLRSLEKTKTEGRSAALVMNANPFTLGHQYLVETAAAACDTLHLFVVSEDASLVPFAVRKRLVAEGVRHLSNVVLHDSGPYIISNATFPSYFLKDEAAVIDGHARLDLAVFTKIAGALNITARYVGEEPTSQVTGLYNQIMKEQLPNLFRHWICRALLAYLEMAAGDRSRKNFLEIMNRPNRYISREALNSSQINFNELREYYKDKDWMCDRITTLETHLRILGTLSPFAAINFIRKGMGFEEYLREYAQYRKIKPEELLETLDRIHESAKGMKTLAKWQAYIEEYTKRLNEQARKQQDKKEGVTISTLHAVKGLEYDIVYILNVNEGSIPYRKAVLAEAVEEERRLFYVGMTRAKKKLVLAYVKRQYEKEREPSRFLEETGL